MRQSDPCLNERPEPESAEGIASAPVPRWGWRVAAVAGLVVVSAFATVLVTGRGGSGGPAPLELSTVSDNVAGHYHYALAHSDAFAQIPCWCGCQQYLGHGNLKDCFVRRDGKGWEAHAAKCGVCIGEAAITAQMLGAGKTPAEVTEAVNTEFGTTAITIPPR